MYPSRMELEHGSLRLVLERASLFADERLRAVKIRIGWHDEPWHRMQGYLKVGRQFGAPNVLTLSCKSRHRAGLPGRRGGCGD